MCEKVILDTNILYYWSKATSSNYDVNKIEATIKNMGKPFVSELTVLEAFVHFRDDKKSLEKVYKFIAEKEIGIIPYFKPEYSILTEELNLLLDNDNVRKGMCDNAFKMKIRFESEFLTWWLVNILSVVGVYIVNKNKTLTKEQFYKFYKQFEALVFSTSESNGYAVAYLKNALIKFYSDGDEAELKTKINDIYFSNLYVLLINFSCAVNDTTILDIPEDSKTFSKEKNTDIFNSLQSEELTKNLLKKIKENEKPATLQKGKQLVKEYNIDIKSAFNDYKNVLEKDLNSYLIEYLELIINKYLLDKNKKINKNDIIDSQIFMQTKNGYSFLTADSDFLKIIENIDESKAQTIRKEISRWEIIKA